MHGDKTQGQREYVLRSFREKKIDCLIATNVAARGLDIPHVTHIFNFDLPREGSEIYVHRIGRTSRMEGEGKAISLVTNEQMALLRDIEDFIKKPIQRLSFDKGDNSRNQSKSRSKSNQSTSFNQNKKKIEVAMPASD